MEWTEQYKLIENYEYVRPLTILNVHYNNLIPNWQ